MDELISRQGMLNRLEEWNTDDPTDKALYNFAWNRIIEQPTIELRCEDCENFNKTRLLIPQSEIIRCKDCKHHHYDSKDIPYCDRIDYGYGWKDDDFCSRAERRTDE